MTAVGLVLLIILVTAPTWRRAFSADRPLPRALTRVGLAACAALGATGTLVLAEPVVDLFYAFSLLGTSLFVAGPLVALAGAVADRRWRKLALAEAALAVGLCAVGGWAWLVEPSRLEVSHHVVESARVERPVRIAVLADLQTDDVGEHERRALEAVRDARPDLVLLPGDFVQHGDGPSVVEVRAALRAALLEVWGPARADAVPAFAVGGDVDGRGWTDLFQGTPVTPLAEDGRTETTSLDELSVTLTGLRLDASRSPSLVLPRPTGDRLHIVFGHAPDFALGDIGADLLLAGHTHGGQVRLPLVGPLMTLSSVPRAWAAGRTDLPSGATLLVSRGVGMERGRAPRLRFLCPPEVVIVDVVPPGADAPRR